MNNAFENKESFSSENLEGVAKQEAVLGDIELMETSTGLSQTVRYALLAVMAAGALGCSISGSTKEQKRHDKEVKAEQVAKKEAIEVVREVKRQEFEKNLANQMQEINSPDKKDRMLREMIMADLQDNEKWGKSRMGHLALHPYLVFQIASEITPHPEDKNFRTNMQNALKEIICLIAFGASQSDILKHFPDVSGTEAESKIYEIYFKTLPLWKDSNYSRGAMMNFASTHPKMTLKYLPVIAENFEKNTVDIITSIAAEKCPRDTVDMKDTLELALKAEVARNVHRMASAKSREYPGRCKR